MKFSEWATNQRTVAMFERDSNQLLRIRELEAELKQAHADIERFHNAWQDEKKWREKLQLKPPAPSPTEMNCVTKFLPFGGWRIENHLIPLGHDKCIYCGLPKEDLEYFHRKAQA